MKRDRVVFLLLPFFLVSCATEVEPPRVQEPVPTARKAGAGRVTFAGLSIEQLSGIRVIPESGSPLLSAANQLYPQVDGFWWRGRPEVWFKIPDFSEAWVGEDPPAGFETLVAQGGLPVAIRNRSIPSWVRKAMGKVGEPGWYPDAGATRSPLSSPWRP